MVVRKAIETIWRTYGERAVLRRGERKNRIAGEALLRRECPPRGAIPETREAVAIGTGPDAIFVREDGANDVAGQTVGCGEGGEALLAQLQEPCGLCAEPQIAFAILIEGFDGGRAAAGVQGFEAALRIAGHGILGADPERALAIFEEMKGAAGGQPIGGCFPGECAEGGEDAERVRGDDIKNAAGT